MSEYSATLTFQKGETLTAPKLTIFHKETGTRVESGILWPDANLFRLYEVLEEYKIEELKIERT